MFKWTLFELGDISAGFADQVVVMVLGQLVARAVPEVQTPHQAQLSEEIQRPVYRHQPHIRAANFDLLQALVLLRGQRLQNRNPLRRAFVTSST